MLLCTEGHRRVWRVVVVANFPSRLADLAHKAARFPKEECLMFGMEPDGTASASHLPFTYFPCRSALASVISAPIPAWSNS
jgi:hypothetical protein